MIPVEPVRGNVVIVDDNPDNLQVLGQMLQQAGYKVRPAISGELALRAVRAQLPDVILLDIRMPGMDGYEICRQLKADLHTREIPVIFISALTETDDKLAAFRVGAVDYVAKPFQAEEVLARVHTHLQLYRMQQHLEVLVHERTQALRASQQQYRRILEQTIHAIALTVEKRDPYTAGHQARVSGLASAIGHQLGLSDERLDGLRLGAMIHDIGKVSMPFEILSRPGQLSEIEFALVKTHTTIGREIVQAVEFPWPVAEMVCQHHERIDGSGYPHGLQGQQILLEAQVIAVADVVEAMASHRPYRPALGLELALAEIRRGAGVVFDAEVVAACLYLFEQHDYRLPALAIS